MAPPAIALHSPVRSCAASIISEIYDDSDAMSEYQPAAVAVQPRRYFQNQIQMLESKARLTSIRSSTLSAVPSTLSQGPGPTLPTSPASPNLFPELHSKPSSVFLGAEENVEKSQLGTSSQSKTLRGQESSSTLHSFYDSQKLPLIVSQQTSDSSSRDFALRKDCPAVLTPESQRKHFFESSKSRLKSKEGKQRKARADLSTLFPKPGTGNRSKERRAENPPYYKMHVKRPKAGIKHWFDSYGDEASDEDDATAAEFEPAMQPDFAEGLGNAFVNLSSHNSPIFKQPSRQLTPPRSMPRTPERTSKSSRILGIEAPIHAQKMRIPPVHSQRALGIPTPRATPNSVPASPMQMANLKVQSVLFLSSDDEDEIPPLPIIITSRPATRLTGGLRESFAESALDNTVIEVGEARTIRSQPAVAVRKAPHGDVPKLYSDPGKSARMRVVVPDRRSSRMGAFFAESSPPMDERQSTRSASSNSRGIANEFSSVVAYSEPLQGPVTPLPVETSESGPRVVSWDEADSSGSVLERRASTRLMPVTRQEQALLAAMRSKKATMRRRSIHQEDSEPWQDEMERESIYEHRPRTSVETIAPAFVELGSNTYADWVSRRRSSIMASQYDAARASVTTFATASQRASTRLSRYAPDDSPDTPASASAPARNSLLLRRTSTGFGTHFSISSSEYLGHSRSRTDSSHIVILDDLNDSPKDLEDRVTSPGYPSWAYSAWSGSPEIATAR